MGAESAIGAALRQWREQRRLTQMELALDAGVSTRHLSFVETGRSRPGRDMLLRVLERLEVPFRERNELLLAAGHAPAVPERSLADPELGPVREALDLVLKSHEPYPAICVDRYFNLVAANESVTRYAALLDVDPELLEPPVNAVRAAFHPRGLGRLMADFGAWRRFWRERIERQLAITGDQKLAELLAELDSYPDPPDTGDPSFDPSAGGTIGPLRVRFPGGPELSFIAMFACFEAPFEVTTSELAIEMLFPADKLTADTLEAAAS